MRYQGGKHRAGRRIVDLIVEDQGGKIDHWVEPFLGGANVACRVPEGVPRMLSDSNKYIARMWGEASRGWVPRRAELTEDAYRYYAALVRRDTVPVDEWALAGLLGCCTFGGKFYGGWARDNRGDDYITPMVNNLSNQGDKLQGATILHAQFQNVSASPGGCIVL